MNTTLSIYIHFHVGVGLFLTGRYYADEGIGATSDEYRGHAHIWLLPIALTILLPIVYADEGYRTAWKYIRETFQLQFIWRFYIKGNKHFDVEHLRAQNRVTLTCRNTNSLPHIIFRWCLRQANKANNYVHDNTPPHEQH